MDRRLLERHTIVQMVEAYGGLLTPRQRQVLQMYYLRDLSSGEIAQHLEVSRQAVFDIVRRSLDELNRLEASLRLLAATDQRSRQRRQIAKRLQALESSVSRLTGRLDAETVGRISSQIAALRRACR